MYNVCKKLILSGNYNKVDMVKKLDIYLLKDRITEEQYNELIELMQNKQQEIINNGNS